MTRAACARPLLPLVLTALLALCPGSARAQAGGEPESEPDQVQPEQAEQADTSGAGEPAQAPAASESTPEAAAEPAEPAPAEAEPAAEPSPEAAAAPVPAAPAAAVSGRALSLYAGAGLGLGTLSFERPTAEGVQVLPQTSFAAAELVLRMHAWPKKRLSLEALLSYQSSIGLVLQAAPLFALPQNVDVRWQRVELGAAPRLRLGDAAHAPSLALALGFVLRSLFPGVHQFSVPKYQLGSVALRPELLLPLGDLVRLRVGPEAEWMMLITAALRSEGACCQGLAVGGRGSVEASVGRTIRIALAYGESHGFIPAGSWRFMDVERFLTARIAGEL